MNIQIMTTSDVLDFFDKGYLEKGHLVYKTKEELTSVKSIELPMDIHMHIANSMAVTYVVVHHSWSDKIFPFTPTSTQPWQGSKFGVKIRFSDTNLNEAIPAGTNLFELKFVSFNAWRSIVKYNITDIRSVNPIINIHLTDTNQDLSYPSAPYIP